MSLPENHPSREALNNEVHARPSEPIETPTRITYLALYTPQSLGEADWRPLEDLAKRYEAIPPRPGNNHYSGDFGAFRLRWERHTEFTRYTFIVPGAGENPFEDPAINMVPPDWLASLPGEVILASHAAIIDDDHAPQELDVISGKFFHGNVLFGSAIGGGLALAIKDFRIQGDRYSRILIINKGMNRRQTGNMIQRLLEVDTYRLLAMMALPVSRELGPFLTDREAELKDITKSMSGAGASDEPALLNRLTALQVDCESRQSEANFRFQASEAYEQLVQRRIKELKEVDVPRLQSLREFADRRFAPAMNTCRAMSARLESLSERAARATQLLSTRVEIERQKQNQQLLAAMNRRAAVQLRLQQTVEGLSVAAITYYVVGLVNYAAKGFKSAGLAIDPVFVTGLSVPIVAGVGLFGLRKVRSHIENTETETKE